jgi:hypothetical protein
MVNNTPELYQWLALTSTFNTSSDLSFIVLQSSGVHFTEVDRTAGFYLHDE